MDAGNVGVCASNGARDAVIDISAITGVWQSGTASFTLVAVGGCAELLYRERVDGRFRGSELVLGPQGWWEGSVHLTQGLPGGCDEEDEERAESEEDEPGLGPLVGWFRVCLDGHGEEAVALSQACAEDGDWALVPVTRSTRRDRAARSEEAEGAASGHGGEGAEPRRADECAALGGDARALVGSWRNSRGQFTVAAVDGDELLYRESIDGAFAGGTLGLDCDGWFCAHLYRTQYEDSQSGDGFSDEDGQGDCQEGALYQVGRVRIRLAHHSGREVTLSQMLLSADAASGWDSVEMLHSSRT